MRTDQTMEKLADESDSELEKTLRGPAPSDDAAATLTRLLWAFDTRRRRREAIAIEQSVQALSAL